MWISSPLGIGALQRWQKGGKKTSRKARINIKDLFPSDSRLILPTRTVCFNGQSPMSSLTTRTRKSVRRGLRSMMVVMRQIRSGELQSQQKPVLAHGVSYLRRLALGGEAHSLTRLIASSTVPSTILFRPATTITFLGPKNIEAARLPVASIFTRT